MALHPCFTDIPTAIEEVRAGRMIVVVDDEDRENEGDLTLAAEKVTPEAINFMAKHGRGLICLAMTEERLQHLRIGAMTPENTSNYGTAFCEAMREDGTMARVPDLAEFCATHNLKMLTVAELIRYRMQHERYVHRVGEAMVDTRGGEFRLIAYESEIDGGESHVALVRGDIE